MLYIFPWLEVWNGPRKACKLSFYQKNFKIVLCLVLFKIKVPKSELNIWVGIFWPIFLPPHTLKNVGVVLAPLMIEVVSKIENFLNSPSYPPPVLLPVSSWSKVAPKCSTKSYWRNKTKAVSLNATYKNEIWHWCIGVGTGGGTERAAAPPTLGAGSGQYPRNFVWKMHFKNSFIWFEKGIFKIKWPKSEEKHEFGGR